MNDPAPPLGQGGWVCAALLLGFFAGSGITWALLSRQPVRAPLVVYPLPPPGAVAESHPSPGTAEEISSVPGNDVSAHSAGVAPPPDRAADAAGPRQISPAVPEHAVTGPAIPDPESLADQPPAPGPHLDTDRLLHGHPKAEGCLANALATLSPFTKKGFNLRDKVWDGEISLEEGKAVSCQLFKGNEYCFCVGTDARGAKLSLQLYRSNGESADAAQSAQELASGASATACWRCSQTGTYFVVVKLEAATQEKVPWGMVSAYR